MEGSPVEVEENARYTTIEDIRLAEIERRECQSRTETVLSQIYKLKTQSVNTTTINCLQQITA